MTQQPVCSTILLYFCTRLGSHLARVNGQLMHSVILNTQQYSVLDPAASLFNYPAVLLYPSILVFYPRVVPTYALLMIIHHLSRIKHNQLLTEKASRPLASYSPIQSPKARCIIFNIQIEPDFIQTDSDVNFCTAIRLFTCDAFSILCRTQLFIYFKSLEMFNFEMDS